MSDGINDAERGVMFTSKNNKPSVFDKQAAASLDMLDEQAAAERVQKILHPETQGARSQAQAGPILAPQPQTQPQAPATMKNGGPYDADKIPAQQKVLSEMKPNRKPRSDKGTHKPKAPADPDEIVLRLSLNDARLGALAIGTTDYCGDLARRIQDQIIAQLQKRLDALTKGK